MRFVMRLFLAIHVALYRATNGKIGGRMFGGNVLILTTTGRRSGKRRDTPVMYVRDPEQDRFAVIASNGGAASHPAWFHNATAAGAASPSACDRRPRRNARASGRSLSPTTPASMPTRRRRSATSRCCCSTRTPDVEALYAGR